MSIIEIWAKKTAYSFPAIAYENAIKTGSIAEDERVNLDVITPLYSDRPTAMGVLTVLDKLARNRTKTTTVKGHEERMRPQSLTIASALSPGAVANATLTIPLAAGEAKHAYEGMTVKIMMSPANSNYQVEGYVTEVDTVANTVGVKPINPTKIFGKSGTASSVPSGTKLMIVGNWNAEFQKAVLQPTVKPNPVTNITQTLRNNFSVSLEAELERTYQVDEAVRLGNIAKYHHQTDVYKSLLFNGTKYQLSQSLSQPTQKNYMGGLESYILGNSTRNMEYASTATIISDFDTFQTGLFDLLLAEGTYKRLAVCNKATRKHFTDLKKDRGWYIFNNDAYMDIFGISGVKTVETDCGQFDLLVDGYVNEFYPNINEPYIMAIHPAYVCLKDFVKTKYRQYMQDNDVLGRMDEWVTIMSIIVFLSESCGVFRKALP